MFLVGGVLCGFVLSFCCAKGELKSKLQKFSDKDRNAVATLNVNTNNVDEIPEEVCHLSSLKTLYVMDNNLTSVPSWIGTITRLTLLAIDRNLVCNCLSGFIWFFLLMPFQDYVSSS
jgi:hypothetical protein